MNNNEDDVIEIDLMAFLRLAFRKIWLILAAAVVFAVLGYIVSRYMITPTYRSSTSVYILNRQNESTLTYSDTQLATQLTNDYEVLVKSRYVLDNVIKNLSLPITASDLSKKITVSNETGTRIIRIAVVDISPNRARAIADEVRTVAAEQIKNVMDIEAVNVVDEADLPLNKYSPSEKKWVVLGAVLGAFLVLVILFIDFLMDDTVKTADDAEKYLGLNTLAVIPILGFDSKKKNEKEKKAKTKKKA